MRARAETDPARSSVTSTSRSAPCTACATASVKVVDVSMTTRSYASLAHAMTAPVSGDASSASSGRPHGPTTLTPGAAETARRESASAAASPSSEARSPPHARPKPA